MAPRLTSQRRSLSTTNIIRAGPISKVRRSSIESNAATTSKEQSIITASGADGTSQKQKRSKCRVTVDITACRYAVIHKCLRERGFRLVKAKEGEEKPKWDIWWSDRGDLLKDLPRLSPFQKINHFPAMEEICRKDFLANNLNAIYKVLPDEFAFFPRSFLLPAESVELQKYMEKAPKSATFIAKPRTLCQGKGISLVQSFAKVPKEPCVVQHYVDNPLLIDGFKFDLRIYVLVFSVHPLRIYIFKNGLARFCTSAFQKPTRRNLNQKRMHLTNYAVNKNSKDFQRAATTGDENTGSKRSLAAIMKYLDDTGRYSSRDVWTQICDIVVKTLLCIQPKLSSSYKSFFGESDATWGPKCFEVLGFDIMLDTSGKAWLFEVNHAPSFAGDSPLDREIKSALISSTLTLIDVTNEKKRAFLKQNRQQWSKRLWSTQPQMSRKSVLTAAISGDPSTQSDEMKSTTKDVSAPDRPEEEGEVRRNLGDSIQKGGDENSVGSGSASENGSESHDDTDHGEDDNEDNQQQQDKQSQPSSDLGAATLKLPRIRNIFQKSNRVSPCTPETNTSTGVEIAAASLVTTQPRVCPGALVMDGIPVPGTMFTNEFAQIYPVTQSEIHDQQPGSRTPSQSSCQHLHDRYENIQAAAEVNKSKLWS